ncbi:unnamed protein product [Cladocopium goreaui]|uniref:Cilia- and flagella-associated protein 157 n=1 Tax=Cladocopium goreaui TaxID=2562237 RepID=A0A9P1M162_9DINO|nr:unnamed protein product [Cladocopium goreaui]
MAEDRSVQQMQSTATRLLQSSPGFAEKLANPKTAPRSGSGKSDDKEAMIAELQKQLDEERNKNRTLEDQYKHRVASFVKREKATMNKIEALEKRLLEGAENDEHSKRMEAIGNMHRSVITGLECIQTNTAKILQDQEKDLMRAFRARLQEVSKDLEAQRSRKGEHSTEQQAHHRRVVAELHKTQELAQTFDKKNQQLTAENQKLQEKLRTREDDRQALLRELVLSRKEVQGLKQQFTGSKESAEPEAKSSTEQEKPRRKSFSQRQIDQARLQQTHNKQYEREVALREAALKLKRMVDAERRTVVALKQQQAEMMQQRTELEVLLRQSLDDVKAEILRMRAMAEGQDPSTSPGGSGPPLSTVLELLLSQQRVVQLLYQKTFPQEGVNPPASAPSQSATASGDEFAWLGDIIPSDEG